MDRYGMPRAGVFAQYFQSSLEVGFGFLILAEALTVACDVDQQRSVLGPWVFRIQPRFVNRTRFCERRGSLIVLAASAIDGAERFHGLGQRGIVRIQNAG